MYKKEYHIHFVGIGGIGMSGIAELLINTGYKVSGSDIALSEITKRLEKLGVKIFDLHHKNNIANANVVVYSSAVSSDNPEIVQAKKAVIPVIPRAEMLAELMRLKYSIAVAGAHGKTTTTSITSWVLQKGGLDPTVVIGGKLNTIGTNAILGKGDYIVAEADESDGSFLKFAPTISIITNIDEDHLDYYQNINAIKETFIQFIEKIPFYGLTILCADDPNIKAIMPQIKKRHTTYAIDTKADITASDITFKGEQTEFIVYNKQKKLGKAVLNLAGIHNVYNALAAIAVALELAIPFNAIQEALTTIPKVERRLEIKGAVNNTIIIDDYGHHPTEIKTTLKTAKTIWKDKRLVVIFQPHRYSRTKLLFNNFKRAFFYADKLIVIPIYSAGEKQIKEATSKSLCQSITEVGHKNAIYIDSKEKTILYLKKALKPNDILITLGAGDVWKIGEALLK
ncbi:MAG: UDP-N-acetylmuramate--L-alanine ligase [Deltaproteobacteria bacterium]|nr:UDP-N-acetylmuramate--L-alanine ligase [Deltaproteobacteria bacterium]